MEGRVKGHELGDDLIRGVADDDVRPAAGPGPSGVKRRRWHFARFQALQLQAPSQIRGVFGSGRVIHMSALNGMSERDTKGRNGPAWAVPLSPVWFRSRSSRADSIPPAAPAGRTTAADSGGN